MENKSRMWRSGLSLILVLCMVISMYPVTAFAEESPVKRTITYVSMGDSMTNGYCLAGYDGNSGAVNYGLDSYANQFAAFLAGTDHNAIKDDQVIFEGNHIVVDHRPLAISGMRAQDIQWALELDLSNTALMEQLKANDYEYKSWNSISSWWYENFCGDRRTWADFVDMDYRYADAAARLLAVYDTDNNGNYFKSSYADASVIAAAKAGVAEDPYYPQKNKGQAVDNYLYISTEYFQESVKDADIISLGVGNTNFGTFMLNAIMDVVMYDDFSFSNTYSIDQAKAQANKDSFALAKVNAMLDSQEYAYMKGYLMELAGGNADKQNAIAYIMDYCMISFITGYVGMLNAILEANPDVQVIMIALMNAYTQEGEIAPESLGELVSVIYNPVNAMLKTLPAELIASKDAETQEEYKNAKFYFANAPYVSCMVDVFGDDFYYNNDGFVNYDDEGLLEGDEDYTPNTASVVRDRFVEEIVRGQFLSGIMGVPEDVSLADFEQGAVTYDMMTGTQKAAFAAQNAATAKQYAMYLGFENALILSGTKNVSLKSLAGLSDISGLLAPALAEVLAQTGANSKNHYAAAAPVVVEVAKEQGASVSAEQVVEIMGAYETMKAKVWAGFGEYHDHLAAMSHPSIDHVIQCETCMEGDAHGQELLKQVVTAYQTALADLPYAIVAETVKAEVSDSMKDLITPDLVKILCQTENSEAYKVAVYTLVKKIAQENMGYTLEDEDIDMLLAEDGEFALAAKLAEKGDADLIKMLYEAGKLDSLVPGASEKIDLLKAVKAGITKLLLPETEAKIKGGAAGVPPIVDGASQLAYLLALPQTMSDVLNGDPDVQGGLTMNTRCILGTGAGAHPSSYGHDSLFSAITDVFPAITHTFTSVVTDPTCAEQGYTTHTCSCGYSYKDSYVPTTEHTWDEGKENDEGIIVYHCLNCTATRNGMPGDANGDGVIDLTDAQCIMKYKIGEDVEIDLDACDVYQDGKVDLQDAQAIMQFKVGKVSELPIIPVD